MRKGLTSPGKPHLELHLVEGEPNSELHLVVGMHTVGAPLVGLRPGVGVGYVVG